ncbi:glycerate kinase type-2 family protein [Haloarcula onubensis]|uniref:DUF4147 domain-containing protein n=1 Tax=Haloarcula onubensis TaxID=2950539 RepID=A0ABU2FM00_9EURY|nr:DUF4147 domain-containing protein [Halomicroarcula sp. S3CR25-11]MDS0281793.1 DUF4147 domain-containing protein [Halomicroarcula sp. S3CR25-11]
MISNRPELERTPAHGLALDCVESAITAAAPERATRASVGVDGTQLRVDGESYDLAAYDEVVVVGGGKAAAGVTAALESLLGDRLTDGCIVTEEPADLDRVRVRVGDHPVPTERNVAATRELLELLETTTEDTLVIAVVTGGASALLAAPARDLTLSALRETTDALLESGAPIAEMNAVRKHLSATKGGQLARAATPATVVGLALSDVVGDDLSVVGSGPTVPDGTTYADALGVLDRYDVAVPEAVRSHLEAGDGGDRPETPAETDPTFERTRTVCLGTNGTALDAAVETASEAGYDTLRLTSRLRGQARHVGQVVASVAESVALDGEPVEPPAVVVAGGETTVQLDGEAGRGGPNQELALAAALDLPPGPVLAAVDTDGEDGSSDAAGAIVDASTVTDTARASERLDAHDAGTVLADAGAAIRTGPTGTNVNDVVVVVVPETGPREM